MSAKDAVSDGRWNLYDANQLIGKTNLFFVRDDYITIIKDGAGVGRVRLLPKNSAFIGTMGALLPFNSDLLFDYALLTKADLSSKFSGSTIPHIYFKDYGNEIYRVPSLFEQEKIGNLFNKLAFLITLHQRKLIFLKSHRFLMSVLFCYSWEQRKLGDIGKTFTGLSGKTSNDFGHGEAKFLPYLNIFNNPIADVSFLESTEIDKSQNEIEYGDVFFTTSSETPDEVGMSSVWLGNGGNIYLNSFCFGFRPSIDFNPYYFGYLLRSDTFRNPVTILAQGISRFNISKNKVMEIEIPLPKKEEQEKIGQLFYKLDSLITLHQRKQVIKEDKKNVKKTTKRVIF